MCSFLFPLPPPPQVDSVQKTAFHSENGNGFIKPLSQLEMLLCMVPLAKALMWVRFHHHSSWFPSGKKHLESISTFHSCICISCSHLCHLIIVSWCQLGLRLTRLLWAQPAPWEQYPCQHYTDIATLPLFRSLRTSKNSFHLEKPTKISAQRCVFVEYFSYVMCITLARPDHQSHSAKAGEELLCIQVYFCPHEGDGHTAPALILQMASCNCDPGGCAPPPFGFVISII